MNAQGRKEIAKHIASLKNIKSILESMRDDEEMKYDNMPEGLQESERGDQMQEAIDAQTKNSNIVKTAMRLRKKDFAKDLLRLIKKTMGLKNKY